jgi:Zn-dependent peptidase ImmA (M78 family)
LHPSSKRTDMKRTADKPRKITIGSWKYRIHYVSGEKRNNALAGNSWAVIDTRSKDIWVDKSLSPREVRFVLVHEVLHAVSDTIEGPRGRFSNEKYCRPFTCFLINALESAGLFPEHKIGKKKKAPNRI